MLQVSDKHDEKSEALLRRGWCEIATISQRPDGYVEGDRNILWIAYGLAPSVETNTLTIKVIW